MMQQLQTGRSDMAGSRRPNFGSRGSSIAAINAPYLVRSTTDVAAKLVRHDAAPKLLARSKETGTIGSGLGHHRHARVVFSTATLRREGHQGA